MSDQQNDKKSIYDPRYKNLINYLLNLRKKTNLSQLNLAKKLKLSQSDISKIETCERRIDFIEVIDWLIALGLDPEDYILDILKVLNVKK